MHGKKCWGKLLGQVFFGSPHRSKGTIACLDAALIPHIFFIRTNVIGTKWLILVKSKDKLGTFWDYEGVLQKQI